MTLLIVQAGWAHGAPDAPPGPRAIHGVLDLRDWDFDKRGTISLSGEWRFAWGELLPPAGTARSATDTTFPVPTAWNGKRAGNASLTAFGHATYQLTLLLPPHAPSLHLDVPEINMAYDLWANSRYLAGAGTVGTSPASEVPRSVPKIVALPEGERIHLVMHVSNYYHFEGGIIRMIKLDRSEVVIRNSRNRLLINVFSMGALFFLGLHYLVIYLNRRTEIEPLLYSALAFLFLIRLITANQLSYVFIDHPHIISTRLSYTTVFMLPPVYLLFLHLLFPQEVSKRLAQGLLMLGMVGLAVVYATPAHVFTLSRDTWIVVIQLAMLYAVGCVTLAAFRRREDSFIVLGIVTILGSTILYDTLIYQRLFYANDIAPYGFLAFIFGHAAILGRRANRAFVRESAARIELAELSANLQSRVDERTAELSTKVTQLEEQERNLQAARTGAERANSAKTRFLAAASHDLRQPLHALNLYVEMLESSIRKGTWQAVVSRVTQSLASLDRLLTGLGEVSRLESGLLMPSCEHIPLQPCLDYLQAEFEVVCADKGLELQVIPTSLWVESDEEMLERMLRNLISNAIKYTARGKILVGCRRSGQDVRIEVHDTGPGIDPAHHEMIFEEFYRLDSLREVAPGAGLGLSIVKHMSQLLNHRIDVTSSPGKGSCFAITLPRVNPGMTTPQPASTSSPGLDGLRVIFVDDDETIRDAMAGTLSGWGCVVRCLASALEVGAALDDGYRPDLLITDFHLRGGENALHVIDELETRIGSVPVLIVTAESARDNLATAAARGYAMLFKPVAAHELHLAISNVMARSEKVERHDELSAH